MIKQARRALSSQVWMLFVILDGCISTVSDGWSGKPSPLLHQFLLLPVTLVTAILLCKLLSMPGSRVVSSLTWLITPLVVFELASLGLIGAESRHFHLLGYGSVGWQVGATALLSALLGVFLAWRPNGRGVLGSILLIYAAGILIAVCRFPLNYLRSDMLPVITWADTRLLHGLNPYSTMHVGTRLYDFPYLPGMLVAFLPILALHLDPRIGDLLYLLGVAGFIFVLAGKESQVAVAASIGAFLLCPFLQYRHDLYLQPHWFCLAYAVFLQRRGRNLWSAVLWGISCAVYQLSWVIVPFFLLLQWRRDGLRQLVKVTGALGLGAGLILIPFLPVAASHIAHNTVGQWNHLAHALADPMNFSYWITYVVPPADLRWVQAVVLVGIFVFCLVRRRCEDQTDMLRWMTGSLAIFVSLNVLVDGYFYLTVLLLLTMYVCSLNGWWAPEKGSVPRAHKELAGP